MACGAGAGRLRDGTVHRGAPVPPVPQIRDTKKPRSLELYSKGQFSKNTVYLERGMPYFAFVSTNAVLVSKIDKS